MRLVFIYGPPAVGKMTVARELSKITGFKLFHNHMTQDMLVDLFGLESKYMHELNSEFRLKILTGLAQENTDSIFTHCYIRPDKKNHHPSTQEFIMAVIENIEKQKGKVLFVRLYCDKKELFKRVVQESRKNFVGKDKSIEDLNKSLELNNITSEIPLVKNLSIDTTNFLPEEVAIKIKEHYLL